MPETCDSISGLGLTLRQSSSGHRVGLDAVLLTAAAWGPAPRGIVDVGAGVGAVGLALARHYPGAEVDLVEIDPETAALARANAEANGLTARVVAADVLSPPSRRAAGLVDGAADLVATNPPFYDAATARISPDPARARAHALAAPLSDWLRASLALLAPGGRFAMIHRADALPEIYAALERRLGAVAVRPVHPRADADAIRVLVTGVKGSRAPPRLLPSLVLHKADGRATPAAAALHAGGVSLWP
jgi:tRNA1(Val) A37 N6-methylase TrmN6